METVTWLRASAIQPSAVPFSSKGPISLPLRRTDDRAQRGRETAICGVPDYVELRGGNNGKPDGGGGSVQQCGST